ncbi:hypothetical protein F0L74_22430 [Chitinophaga agrisoli]|uniref:Uncharacterized protein n=1 Tax=Chitinophaga agrisoli TaxID=2607653 RepID=A0A5B2VJ85_9BACT|nr:hypothetical protein [Chitinophaga agrisoli]KAA2238974.1 hypothetical protein F0L74_22430 [Chitinophaga agrisoli]
MGQRTYLSKITPKKAATLFEANNFLPFFWLTLIRAEHLAQVEPAMREMYEMAEDEEAFEKYQDENTLDAANINISKKDAIANMQGALPLISVGYPEWLPLYQDFIAYIDKFVEAEDRLALDIYALSAFTDIDDYITGLREDLQAIANHEPAKVTGYFADGQSIILTGYVTHEASQFSGQSPQYKKAIKQPVQRPASKPLPVPKAILMTVIAIALLYVPYRGYLKEGWSFTVVCMIAALLAFVYYSIKQLWRAIRK